MSNEAYLNRESLTLRFRLKPEKEQIEQGWKRSSAIKAISNAQRERERKREMKGKERRGNELRVVCMGGVFDKRVFESERGGLTQSVFFYQFFLVFNCSLSLFFSSLPLSFLYHTYILFYYYYIIEYNLEFYIYYHFVILISFYF